MSTPIVLEMKSLNDVYTIVLDNEVLEWGLHQ